MLFTRKDKKCTILFVLAALLMSKPFVATGQPLAERLFDWYTGNTRVKTTGFSGLHLIAEEKFSHTVYFNNNTESIKESNVPGWEHFGGRYLINLIGTSVAWTLSWGALNLVSHGSTRPRQSQETWLERNPGAVIYPVGVLTSSLIGRLLFENGSLKTFLETTAWDGAEMGLVSIWARQTSDWPELYELFTLSFVVPLTSTLFYYLIPKVGTVKVGDVRVQFLSPKVTYCDKKLLVGGRIIEIRW